MKKIIAAGHVCLDITPVFPADRQFSTFRRTPISRSPLDKNPMPGQLSELQPQARLSPKQVPRSGPPPSLPYKGSPLAAFLAPRAVLGTCWGGHCLH